MLRWYTLVFEKIQGQEYGLISMEIAILRNLDALRNH